MVYFYLTKEIFDKILYFVENGLYNSFEDEQREPKDFFKLPPKWLDIYDETKDELSKIKEISTEEL